MDKRLEEIKSEYNNISVPDEALSRIRLGIEKARTEEASDYSKKDGGDKLDGGKVKAFPIRKVAVGFAAALGLCILVTNSSYSVAQTLGEMPVVGNFFKVLTVRRFTESIGNADVDISVPEVSDEAGESTAVNEVNADIEDYIAEIYDVFMADVENDSISYQDLTVTHKVLANDERYFSLDITGVETSAGGYEFHKFYTVDKTLDKVLTLDDVYGNTDYIEKISDEIIRQMNEEMESDPQKTYYIGTDEYGEDGFTTIDPQHDFYINENGEVVICFNEYEVAPGSMGAPQFTIPDLVK